QGDTQLLRPVPELIQVVPEQRVLVLSVGRAAASSTTDVLGGLKEDADSGDRVEFGPQARNDPVCRNIALRAGPESQIDACAGSATASSRSKPAAPNRARHALYRRILLDDAGDLLQLGLHQLERSIRISPNRSADRSGIL